MNDNTIIDGKKCRICGDFKDYTEFYKDKCRKDGFSNRCKICDRKESKKYQQKNKETLKEKRIEYRKENKDKVLEIARKSYEKNRERHLQRFCEYQQKNAKKIKIRKSEHYKDNKEYIREKIKMNYEENKERYLEYAKQYREENKEKVNEQSRLYYAKNQENEKKRRKEWYYSKGGREKTFVYNMKRRSYKNHVRFEGVKRKNILNRDNWTCQKCGCKVHDRTTGDWNTPDKAHIDHIIPISKGGHSEPSNLQVLCRTCNLSKHDKILNTI